MHRCISQVYKSAKLLCDTQSDNMIITYTMQILHPQNVLISTRTWSYNFWVISSSGSIIRALKRSQSSGLLFSQNVWLKSKGVPWASDKVTNMSYIIMCETAKMHKIWSLKYFNHIFTGEEVHILNLFDVICSFTANHLPSYWPCSWGIY